MTSNCPSKQHNAINRLIIISWKKILIRKAHFRDSYVYNSWSERLLITHFHVVAFEGQLELFGTKLGNICGKVNKLDAGKLWCHVVTIVYVKSFPFSNCIHHILFWHIQLKYLQKVSNKVKHRNFRQSFELFCHF